MANHHQQSPGGLHLHHGMHTAHVQVNGHMSTQAHHKITPAHLAAQNESVWLAMGSSYELQGDPDGALFAYEQALRHNYQSLPALKAISAILRTKEEFARAVEYLQIILKLDKDNGEVWGNLGHCYLMIEDLQQAYTAYQQALYYLPDPKEAKLWYGIGILYDRYGSLEHAEEAFSSVMNIDAEFEKANEIYFRLGIIYKRQSKFNQSLECFKYIVQNPPRPLTEEDIWFQIGHFESAKQAYRRVLERDPNHAKVLQQLGWLHHQESPHFSSQESAIDYLEKSVSSDNSDAQSWYLLGRCYMAQQKYSKAYEAYQQAVYRDGRNPTFWCSIGVLYYQINQYRDALDAYSRAIRLNPYISEVWYDLGTLYESCNNQTADALDAYQRAYDLDSSNQHIKARLHLLRNNGQPTGMNNQGAAPEPQDVHPQHYQAPGVGAPPGPIWGPHSGPPAAMQVQGPGGAQTAHLQDWNRRLADIQQPAPQLHPPNPFDPRDAARAPPSQRPASPRSDQMRQYQEQQRHLPARRSSPPSGNHVAQNSYSALQAVPQSQLSVTLIEAPPPHHPASSSYGAQASRYAPNNSHTAPAPGAPPYGRGLSPPPEIKPITEARTASPGPNYPHQPYQHHPEPSQSVGIAAGAPPPAAAMAAAEAAARERDDRPPTGFKRAHESDEEQMAPIKHAANGETRSRLEDHHHRRPSPPDRKASPRQMPISPRDMVSPPRGRVVTPPRRHSRSSSGARREEQRRADENYHPSEAAHHPPTLPMVPPPAQAPNEAPPTPASDVGRDERKEAYEAAARKMDVDEDYDDDPEDEKRKSGSGGRSSPLRGSATGPANVESEAA